MPRRSKATAAVRKAMPAVASTEQAAGSDSSVSSGVSQACFGLVPARSFSVYDAKAAGGGVLFTHGPPSEDGGIDYFAPWGPNGDEYWEFRVKQAVAAVRGNAVTNSQGQPSAQDTKLQKVISAAAMPKMKGGTYDMLEERACALTARVRAIPSGPYRRSEAIELYERAVMAPLDRYPAGIRQAEEMMDVLNGFGIDVDEHGRYLP